MIQLEGVSKVFPPDQEILSDISFTVEDAEWVWVLGDTGIGKSVLLKLCYGALDPTSGQVTVLGENVPTLTEKKLARLRSRIGLIFQDIRLLDSRTSLDNISLVLSALGVKIADARDKGMHWLDKVGVADISNRCPYELSVGQRQKVALARALAKEPELLILDEPFSALDEKQERAMLKLLGEINHAGTTILAASHSQEVLHFLPGRVLQLSTEGLS